MTDLATGIEAVRDALRQRKEEVVERATEACYECRRLHLRGRTSGKAYREAAETKHEAEVRAVAADRHRSDFEKLFPEGTAQERLQSLHVAYEYPDGTPQPPEYQEECRKTERLLAEYLGEWMEDCNEA